LVRSGNTFPSDNRLRCRREFVRVWEKGRKIHTPHFVVIILEKSSGPTRLGLTVSRKVGGAVKRNRIKRLIREFFRNNYNMLPQHADLSIIAKKGAFEVDYKKVCDELSTLKVASSPSGTPCLKNLPLR
jgi:ribonuclease P protein component